MVIEVDIQDRWLWQGEAGPVPPVPIAAPVTQAQSQEVAPEPPAAEQPTAEQPEPEQLAETEALSRIHSEVAPDEEPLPLSFAAPVTQAHSQEVAPEPPAREQAAAEQPEPEPLAPEQPAAEQPEPEPPAHEPPAAEQPEPEQAAETEAFSQIHSEAAADEEPLPLPVDVGVSPLEVPEPAPDWLRIGRDRLEAGDLPESIKALEHDGSREGRLLLGLAQWKAGSAGEAARIFDRLIEQDKDDYVPLQCRTALALQVGDLTTAPELEAQLADSGQTLTEFCYNLGILQAEAGLPQAAILSFRRAVGKRPRFAEALLNLGTTLERMGRTNEAIDAWKIALEIKPELSEGYFAAR